MPSALPTQIPKWISRHCVYHELCASAIMEIDQDLTPRETLARVKEIVWQMAPQFKARLRMKPPRENCETLHFAMMAFRGWRMCRFDQRVRAIRAYPRLLQYFDPDHERCVHIAGLGALVQSLKDAWYESEERAMDGWEGDEKFKAKAMARLQHLRRA
eukprot:7507264-Pyramimonas_sp.AAC.1